MTSTNALIRVAMAHLAMFDAVNSTERRYRPYLVQPRTPRATLAEAAAASAAGGVLSQLPSDQQEAMRARLDAYLAQIPEGPGKTAGVALGRRVAARILESRANELWRALRARDSAEGRGQISLLIGSTMEAACERSLYPISLPLIE